MNKRRLLKLADLLEADAKKKKGIKFSLRNWGKYKGSFDDVRADCGTVGCAVGLACVSGTFPGLSIYQFGLNGIAPQFTDEDGFYHYGWEAVERLFALDNTQARRLFSSDEYRITTGAVAERAVAKRIRHFVAGTAAP